MSDEEDLDGAATGAEEQAFSEEIFEVKGMKVKEEQM